MTRILGIDPGSRITGFGIVDAESGKAKFVDCGTIRTPVGDLAGRLKSIFDGITEIIEKYQPNEIAIERVFMHKNPDSALKLGQARGAAIVAVMNYDLDVNEYTPAEVKKSIVGRGNADKGQIQHMVRALLGLSRNPQADAADALAIALTHIHVGQTMQRITQVTASRGGRYR